MCISGSAGLDGMRSRDLSEIYLGRPREEGSTAALETGVADAFFIAPNEIFPSFGCANWPLLVYKVP